MHTKAIQYIEEEHSASHVHLAFPVPTSMESNV